MKSTFFLGLLAKATNPHLELLAKATHVHLDLASSEALPATHLYQCPNPRMGGRRCASRQASSIFSFLCFRARK